MANPDGILLTCPVMFRRQAYDLFFTEDRMHLLPQGQSDGAFVLLLTSIFGHQVNKSKDGATEQKTLVKISSNDENGNPVDRVLDFCGPNRIYDQRRIDELLRALSGDRAAERQVALHRERDALAHKRARFLTDRPALCRIYETLVEKEASVTAEEFWNRYENEVECYSAESPEPGNSNLSVPVPLRAPERPKSVEVGGKEILITAEKAREIFSQYPQAKELFDSAVPHAVSEKDFWRRFFQCQFFWKSQGSDHESSRDPVFDALTKKGATPQQAAFSALPISPEIDLCPDWLGESRRDGASTVELGGATATAAAEAYGSLARRFNSFGSSLVKPPPTVGDIEQISEIRKSQLERIENVHEIISAPHAELTKLLASYQIPRNPALDQWTQISRNFQVSTFRASPGLPGVDAATLELTTAMSAPLADIPISKTAKNLEISNEKIEFDDLAGKIAELLRNIWDSENDQVAKRDRHVHALSRYRDDLENWLGRVGPQWAMAVRGILAPMERAERVSKLFKTS